jgi:hypothetical protein
MMSNKNRFINTEIYFHNKDISNNKYEFWY